MHVLQDVDVKRPFLEARTEREIILAQASESYLCSIETLNSMKLHYSITSLNSKATHSDFVLQDFHQYNFVDVIPGL
jgi:hypothetical protein